MIRFMLLPVLCDLGSIERIMRSRQRNKLVVRQHLKATCRSGDCSNIAPIWICQPLANNFGKNPQIMLIVPHANLLAEAICMRNKAFALAFR